MNSLLVSLIACATLSSRSSELTATLVDESLRPLAHHTLAWRRACYVAPQRTAACAANGSVVADASGRIRILLHDSCLGADACPFLLSEVPPESPSPDPRLPFARVALPPPTSGGLELGTLVIAPFGSHARFTLTSDDELQRSFEAPRERNRTGIPGGGDPHEEVLAEIARRGGDRWRWFVRAALERARAPEFEYRSPGFVGELELLTALRRIEGLDAPCTLELLADSVLAPRRERSPVAHLALRNEDPRRESFELWLDANLRVGDWHVQVEAIGPDGRRCEPAASREFDHSGARLVRLDPGETIDVQVRLQRFVRFDAPGTYRVRVHYHDKEQIGRSSETAGRLVVSTAEFGVAIAP